MTIEEFIEARIAEDEDRCAALRAVVAAAKSAVADTYSPDAGILADDVLAALVGMWSDHPDYRPEWAVDAGGPKS